MTLRDDIRWIDDALDSMLVGALPVWPPKWSTETGWKISGNLRELHRRYFLLSCASTGHAHEVARLNAEIDGLRTTNEVLTNMLETKEST